MNKNIDLEIKQAMIDFKTMCAYADAEYYGDITEKLENVNKIINEISDNLAKKKEHIHMDDDNTHHVLRESLEFLEDATDSIYSAYTCFEDLKFYTGDGHRI